MRSRSSDCETALTFRIPAALAEQLKDIARRRSLFERRAVSVVSLVRDAVTKVYADNLGSTELPTAAATASPGTPNQKGTPA